MASTLTTAFTKVAKRAVLTTVLATTLASGSAFAQSGPQAGPPPTPNNAQTQTYGQPQVAPGQLPPGQQPTVPVKPWENDRNYQSLVAAYDHQMSAREKSYQAGANGQLQVLDGNIQMQEANIAANQANYMRSPQGMAQEAAAQAQISGQQQAQTIQIKATLQNQDAREDISRSQYLMQLDQRFSQLPQYRNGGQGIKPDASGHFPWETDPAYLAKLQLLDTQQGAQRQIDGANETAQLRVMDANHASQEITLQSQNINAMRQGMAGMARISAQDKILNAQYNMQRISTQANYDLRAGQQEAQRAEYVYSLDQTFSQMPQYKTAAPAPATRPATVKPPGS